MAFVRVAAFESSVGRVDGQGCCAAALVEGAPALLTTLSAAAVLENDSVPRLQRQQAQTGAAGVYREQGAFFQFGGHLP